MEFIFGAVVVLGIWFFSAFKTKVDNAKGDIIREAAAPWLVANKIQPSEVFFAAYGDPLLVRNKGAVVLVGPGKNMQGKSVGLVLEVLPDKGVVLGEFLIPEGISLRHKSASHVAIANKRPLIDVMLDMAADHRRALTSKKTH